MGSTSKPPRTRPRIDLRTALRRLPFVLGLTAVLSLVALTIAWSYPATLPPDISTGVAVGLAAWLTAFSLAAVSRGPAPWDGQQGDGNRDVPPEAERAPSHPPHDLRILRTPQEGPSLRVRTPGGVRRFGQTEALPLDGDRRRCTADLAAHLLEQAGDEPIEAGLGPLDDHLAGRGWATGLAEELARAGRKVLLVDLAAPAERRPGIPEVALGEVELDDAMEYHRSLRIARLGPGSDRRSAAAELPTVLADLPEGVDAVIVQLPQMGGATVATAARHIAHLVFVAVRGHTRVGAVRRTESISREELTLTIALVDPAHGEERPVGWDPAPIGADGRPMPGSMAATNGERRPTPPNRGDIWRRELAHASEEIDTTLGDGLDPEDVWGTDDDPLRDRPPPDDEEVLSIDPASVWGVDGEEPSRSMSSSTDARGSDA